MSNNTPIDYGPRGDGSAQILAIFSNIHDLLVDNSSTRELLMNGKGKYGFLILVVMMFSLVATEALATATNIPLSGLATIQPNAATYETTGKEIGELATGDFNCDGYDDLVIGSGGYSYTTGSGSSISYYLFVGRIFIKFGGSTLSSTFTISDTVADVTITGSQAGEGLGANVLLIDINDDGCDDLISTSASEDVSDGISNLYIYMGNSSWAGNYTNGPSVYDNKLSADQSYEPGYYYWYLYDLGPLDGDINSDSEINEEDHYIGLCSDETLRCYLISAPNLSGSGYYQDLASYFVEGTDPHRSMASGDVDGDGYYDLLVGDPDTSSYDNATIYFGPLSSSGSLIYDSSETPVYKFVAGTVGGEDVSIGDMNRSNSGFGDHVEVATILDPASGYADIIIGNPNKTSDAGYSQAGSVHVISGESIANLRNSVTATSGILIYGDYTSGTYNLNNIEIFELQGDDISAKLGLPHNSLAKADINGDGYNDLLLGSSRYANSSYHGTSYIMYGGALDDYLNNNWRLSITNGSADKYLVGDSASYGLASNVVSGDLNGDNLDDVIIASDLANSELGETKILYGAVTDMDSDGFNSAYDPDGDGVYETYDCNDKDSAVVPSAWYRDADGDGYGSASITTTTCSQPSGYVSNDDDCNDSDASVSPSASETCDSVDNDCDGSVDDGVMNTYYLDLDGDGYGRVHNSTEGCSAPAGYVAYGTDCDNGNAAIHPGATEVCDGVDNDCDDVSDEGVRTTYYRDADGDGHGDASTTLADCSAPTGYVATADDCNDSQALAYTGAAEACDSVDNDCDGSTDEGVTAMSYRDTDGDGYGDASVAHSGCAAPTGYVGNDADCDDTEALAYSGAAEVCDGVDNDCDGTADAGLLSTYFEDADGDGYGNATVSSEACSAPAGYVADATDCDDTDGDILPGGPNGYEIGANGLDDNCDGLVDDNDHDQDGFYWSDGDCDDDDSTAHPGATEDLNNGRDEDCNGLVDEITYGSLVNDDDGDGYVEDGDGDGIVDYGYDCDDTDPNVFPGGPEGYEVGGNDKDDNCDGLVNNNDYDGDGYYWQYVCQNAGRFYNSDYPCEFDGMTTVAEGLDCDDTDSNVNLGRSEVSGNGIDDNCNDAVDESSFASVE